MPALKNISFSHTSKFRLSFPWMPFLAVAPNKEAGEGLTLYCSEAILPGITLTPEQIGTPYGQMYIGSNNITFGQLGVTYHVDELFSNYEFIYKWMMFMKDPERYAIHNTDGMVNASLHIFTNNDNTKFHFRIINCFPVGLGTLNFSKTSTDGNDLEQGVTFQMDYYQLIRD